MSAKRGAGGDERGRLAYRLGDEQDRTHLPLFDDTVVTFGRAEHCEVRFGHGPVRDIEVPRVAGWFLVTHGRVIVEAAAGPRPEGDGDGEHRVRRALEVRFEGGPPVPIAPGAAYSPACDVFTVEIAGSDQTWEIDVVTRSDDDQQVPTDAGGEPLTNNVRVELDALQQEVLAAYADPVLAGGFEPATHDQVAAKVFMSRSAVRRVLDRISDEFYKKRLWFPDSTDTRVRVVEAARHNQILRGRPDVS